MEHTKGPWRELAPGVIAGAADPGWGAIASVPHADTEPESAANAKLIAAAPALLEALEQIATEAYLRKPGVSMESLKDIERVARAAIEAAK